MVRVLLRSLLVSAATIGSVLAGGLAPALAATPRPTGTDVSYALPGTSSDCVRGLTSGVPFALVGVNSGLPTGTNPCLVAQLAWAATATGTGRPAVEVYVNAANPGDVRRLAAWWPSADRTRAGKAVPHVPGRCSGGNTVACAYVYGWSIAADDLGRGVPSGVHRWWIDVETANTWSSRSTERNRSVVEGMSARFTAAGHVVGLYGLPSEVPFLLGTIAAHTALASAPTWISGDGDAAAAAHRCTLAPFSGGRTTLSQYTVSESGSLLGQDVACGTFSAAPKPHVTGSRVAGTTLTATANGWRPSPAHRAYRWLRDGQPISGATHSTYRPARSDRGHRIAVTVTATLDGISRGVRTSVAVVIAS